MISISSIKKSKNKKQLTMLTAYDAPTAHMLESSGIDMILVGDSLGNVVLGYDNTLPVTVAEMLHHVKSVRRGARHAFVVADMPLKAFASNPLFNAKFLIKAGANAVKIEGIRYLSDIKNILNAGIPVMGHIGFTPQYLKQLGGYKVQGKTPKAVKKLIEEAKLLEKAGVFSIVLEMVPASVGKLVSKSVNIPVIGCGAGPYCDGQVLVVNDVLGLTPDAPRFAKKYANIFDDAKKAVLGYISEVKSGKFPDKKHSF